MAQLLIMYKQPADPAAFEEYYFSTHVPIFADTPGIRATTFSKGPIRDMATIRVIWGHMTERAFSPTLESIKH